MTIRESKALHPTHDVRVDERLRGVPLFGIDKFTQLSEKPRIDCCQFVQLGSVHAELHRTLHLKDAFWCWLAKRGAQRLWRAIGETIIHQSFSDRPSGTTGFERAQRLLECFLERAADGHRLANGFHLRGESGIGGRELLERKAWTLDDHVIEHGLEAGRGGARNIVWHFIKREPDGELCSDARDRKPRSFRGKR